MLRWVVPILSCAACYVVERPRSSTPSLATSPRYEAAKAVDHEQPTTLSLYEQQPAPSEPKVEREAPRERVADPPIVQRALITDLVSQQVMATGQPSFISCYRRALKSNPLLGAVKVVIDVDVDPTGVVTDVRTNAEDTHLSACFGRVVMRLKFPPPDEPGLAKLIFIAQPG